MSELRLAHETRRACFCALTVAVATGEGEISARRIAAAVLRDAAVRAVCDVGGISVEELTALVDDQGERSFQQVLTSIEESLAAREESFGSSSHINSIQPLPLSSNMKKAFEAMADRGPFGGHLAQ